MPTRGKLEAILRKESISKSSKVQDQLKAMSSKLREMIKSDIDLLKGKGKGGQRGSNPLLGVSR